MKAIMVMFDTLSRRFLSTYGNKWVKTPNFERLKKKSIQFDNFYCGSLPCMPARRELHTGRYNFLHRSWGPLEPFDDSVIERLKENGVYTHIVTDHNHYWEDGGATYLSRYNSWEGFRGQEGDNWVGIVDKASLNIPKTPSSTRRGNLFYSNYANRTRVKNEEDYSSVQSVMAGLDFMSTNYEEDNWFLQIECFDPHEPFVVPQRFLDMYEEIPTDIYFDWPSYAPVCETPEEQKQVITRYAALITMCDENLGLILDKMDEQKMWDETLLIVNTDHGFLTGEHEWWGKSVQPQYQEISHIPFYIHLPGYSQRDCKQLAQTIDIAPTLLNFFGIDAPAAMKGEPLQKALKNNIIHEAILFGSFGNHVNITDGSYVYMRGPLTPQNEPLNEYTLMPMQMKGFIQRNRLERVNLVSNFTFMHRIPVLKIPFSQALSPYYFGNRLYNIKEDPQQVNRLDDNEQELLMLEKMRKLLIDNETPNEQYQRLGMWRDSPLSEKELIKQKNQRKEFDTVLFPIKITEGQLTKLRFLKSVMPGSMYVAFIHQLSEDVTDSSDFDVILGSSLKSTMQKLRISRTQADALYSFVEKATEIQ